MDQQERDDLAALIEARTSRTVEEAMNRRFDVLQDTINKSHESDRLALRSAYTIVGGALSIAVAIVAFFGIRTWADIDDRVRKTVQERLSSDVVVQEHIRQVNELKVRLIVGRLAQELVAHRQGDEIDARGAHMSAEELKLLETAIRSGGETAENVLVTLRQAFEVEIIDENDETPAWRALVAAAQEASQHKEDRAVRGSAWAFLSRCPFVEARADVILDLRRLYEHPEQRPLLARELRDNGSAYLLRIATQHGLTRSMREDASVAATAAVNASTGVERVMAMLALAFLESDLDERSRKFISAIGVTPITLSGIGTVTDPSLFAQTPLDEADRDAVANAFAVLFARWSTAQAGQKTTDIRSRVQQSRYIGLWKRLATEEELYKAFAERVITNSLGDPQKLTSALRALFDLPPARPLRRSSPRLYVEIDDAPLRVVRISPGRLELEGGATVVPDANTRWSFVIVEPERARLERIEDSSD